MLASFTARLRGTPGIQVHYSMPKTVQEALQIAITVEQAKLQERQNEAFYLEAEARRPSTADRPLHGLSKRDSAETQSQHRASSRTQRQGRAVRVNIRGVSREFIVDSGSSVLLIQPGIYCSEVRPSSTTSFGVTGDELDILGEQDVQFSPNNWNYGHTFCVCSLPTEADGILRMDFLLEMKTRAQVAETSDVKSRFFEPENTWSQR